jgi:cyclic pyranopterin phosphate synthase
MGTLQDAFGRHIHYLRLSVTDRCNFRCVYCLPQGCNKGPESAPLSLDEIERLARGFARLGFWKVRLTGGEPTTRSDIAEITRTISDIPGIRRVGLTTNGYRLTGVASALCGAGLSSLNVSLDSLDPERFARLTGCSRLESIVAGVEAALEAGIPSVKVNVVLLQDLCDREFDQFLAWTRRLPLGIRFIELMQTGENGAFFRQHHLSAEKIRLMLESRGWARLAREESDGPAKYYGHPGHLGKVGLIAPYSAGFCEACNRVRVSSTGNLRLCLFDGEEIPLRQLLQSHAQEDDLVRLIESSIKAKPASHRLQQGRCEATTNLASIGG